MRICVTGAAGYIGGWLLPALSARGHDVYGQDIQPGAGARFDLHHPQSRRAWLDAAKPDLVVHLAALYGRVWGERDLARTASDNAGLTGALARDVAAAGARLLYVSSSEVYGAAAAAPVPLSARSALHPLNMYGLSKKWGEEAARLYCPGGLVIARLNMPYGPARQPLAKGEAPHHSGRAGPRGYNALHTMCWQAAHGLPITVHAATERCFTWIGDAAYGLVLAAEKADGTLNVCRADEPVPMGDLAKRCAALAGRYIVITEEDPPAGVTPRKDLDDGPLRSLGWVPQTGLETGLPVTYAHMARFGRDGKWQG